MSLDDISANVRVNTDKKEMQDINSAVNILVGRYVRDLGKRNPKLKVSSIQSAGSMAEDTALWKSVRRSRERENKFIEYDFVAVLENYGNTFRIQGSCQACRDVYDNQSKPISYMDFETEFHSSLYSTIHSCSCQDVDSDLTNFQSLKSCKNCVIRDTGYLHYAAGSVNFQAVKKSENCSLVFYWTSFKKTLVAPNIETSRLTELIHRLIIRIDLIPALCITKRVAGAKCDARQYVVPKMCPVNWCKDGWRLSNFIREQQAFKGDVTEKHKKCYILIKYLYGQMIYWTENEMYLKTYYLKVAFLLHCQTCPKDDNCFQCSIDILRSLIMGYNMKALTQPFSSEMGKIRLSANIYIYEGSVVNILCILNVISKLSSHLETQPNCVHFGETCSELVQETMQQLLKGKLWLKETKKELQLCRKAQEKYSSDEIFYTLLKNEDLTYKLLHIRSPNEIATILEEKNIVPGFTASEIFRLCCIFQMILSLDVSDIKDDNLRRDVEKLMALPHITRRWTAIDTICHTISDAATVDYRESLNIGCFLGCKESFYAKAKKDDEIVLRLSIIVRGEYLQREEVQTKGIAQCLSGILAILF